MSVPYYVFIVPRQTPNADSISVRVELPEDEDREILKRGRWEVVDRVLGKYVDAGYFIVKYERLRIGDGENG